MKVAIVVSRKISQKDTSKIAQLLAEHPGATIFSNDTSLPSSLSTAQKPFDLDPDRKKR